MSTFDRGSDKPIVCRISDKITREHANRHFPVLLDTDGETGAYDHPKVTLKDGIGGGQRIWGELGSVDEDAGLCQVYRTGLMYLRSSQLHQGRFNGHYIDFSTQPYLASVPLPTINNLTTALIAGISALDPIICEGGFTIRERDANGTIRTVYILKCRRR